ncbi:MAG: WecB/TagA/CpsF family glycosyltransferase [Candidatus Omnitrophota bacterium]
MIIDQKKAHIVVIGSRGFPNIPGGVEKHCEELYPLLIDMGCRVTVLTRKPYVDLSLKQYKGVDLVAIDCPRNKFFEAPIYSFRALLYARRLNPDIIHFHAVGPALVVLLARFFHLKVVLTHHGPDYFRKKWNWVAKLVLRAGEMVGCLFSDRIITISGNIAVSIKRNFGKESVVIPNGVRIPDLVPPGEALAKFGLEQGKYFLAVGRFVPEKGFDDLIEAYAGLKDTSWKLVLVGDADHEDDFSRRLKERAHGVSGVVLTGFQGGRALQEIYSNAGLFVLPSYYEGLPIVLLEALSYGLNCVVSDIDANREVPLAKSRYVKPGKVSDWMEKLQYFSVNPLSEDDRQKQLDLIRSRYSWPDIALKTMDVYRQLLGPTKVDLCGVKIDNVSFEETIKRIETLVNAGKPVSVVTPNVDHIVRFQKDEGFRQAYKSAALVLADGVPILWAASYLKTPLKEKISGSDLFPALCAGAASKGWRLFFLGGRPGAAQKAVELLSHRYVGLNVVGAYSPPFGFEVDTAENNRIISMIKEAKPHILFVGLGAPKQEKWIQKYKDEYNVPVSIGIGVSFEFEAFIVKRAPRWMQKVGLEWFWRLMMEPARLWRRYLVDDMAFFGLVFEQKRKIVRKD